MKKIEKEMKNIKDIEEEKEINKSINVLRLHFLILLIVFAFICFVNLYIRDTRLQSISILVGVLLIVISIDHRYWCQKINIKKQKCAKEEKQ